MVNVRFQRDIAQATAFRQVLCPIRNNGTLSLFKRNHLVHHKRRLSTDPSGVHVQLSTLSLRLLDGRFRVSF